MEGLSRRSAQPQDRLARERDFWNHAIPDVETVVSAFKRGPGPNTRLMMEAVCPKPGRRILDFACGAGLTTAWLASVGAQVTGIDLSPASIKVAKTVADRVGISAEFICADVENLPLLEGAFDAIVGQYALHHLDVEHMAPILARCLGPQGTGAFLETMGLNPFLALARKYLVGRLGVPRFGTLDEHPLLWRDIEHLRNAFPSVALATDEYHFLTMLDRQVLRSRFPRVSRALVWGDEQLQRSRLFRYWSFHQVILVSAEPMRTDALLHRLVKNAPRIFVHADQAYALPR